MPNGEPRYGESEWRKKYYLYCLYELASKGFDTGIWPKRKKRMGKSALIVCRRSTGTRIVKRFTLGITPAMQSLLLVMLPEFKS